MRANEFILSEKRRRRKKSRGFYRAGWFGYPAVDSSDSGGGDGGGVAETQEDIENNLPSIELARNNIAKILQAAQRIYDDWDESDRDTYAGGGICHLIADAICDVMGEIGIECTTVSCSYEQHVYVAVRVAEGVYTIDIPYRLYETGGGFSWQKLPDVKFDSRDVVFYRTSGDPNEFENYTSLEEAKDNILRLRDNAGDGRAQKFIDAVYARYPDTFQNNHVMSWGSGEQQGIALFELVPNIARPNSVDIKWIQAYPLRKGIGSRAMEILQSMAQEHSVALTLYPWDKGQVSQSKLIKFYRQMGFRPTNKGSKNMIWQGVAENFADGKNPGRKGLAKRMGVPTKASVSKLRQIAKSSSGEKQRMAHWMANMKAGKKK